MLPKVHKIKKPNTKISTLDLNITYLAYINIYLLLIFI